MIIGNNKKDEWLSRKYARRIKHHNHRNIFTKKYKNPKLKELARQAHYTKGEIKQ